MSKLAKVIIGLLVFVVLAGSGMLYYMVAPTPYYTQITSQPKEIAGPEDEHEPYFQYEYEQKGYDKNGNERTLTFMTHPDLGRPFREQAYLKVNVSRLKGENGYEEVQKAAIPPKALEKIEQN